MTRGNASHKNGGDKKRSCGASASYDFRNTIPKKILSFPVGTYEVIGTLFEDTFVKYRMCSLNF